MIWPQLTGFRRSGAGLASRNCKNSWVWLCLFHIFPRFQVLPWEFPFHLYPQQTLSFPVLTESFPGSLMPLCTASVLSTRKDLLFLPPPHFFQSSQFQISCSSSSSQQLFLPKGLTYFHVTRFAKQCQALFSQRVLSSPNCPSFLPQPVCLVLFLEFQRRCFKSQKMSSQLAAGAGMTL